MNRKGFMVVEIFVLVSLMTLFGYVIHKVVVGEPCNIDNVCGGR